MQKILAILLILMLVVACSSSDNVENNNLQDTDQTAQHNTDNHDTQDNDHSTSQDTTENSDATSTTNNDSVVNNDTTDNTSNSNDTSNNLVADTSWQSNVDNTTDNAMDSLNDGANNVSDTMNNAVDSANNAMSNTTTSANTSANASGQVILILNFNDLVEEKDKAIITKATKNKWFKDKQPLELTEKAYYDQSAQYMGATVFIAKVLRAYGEFTMNVRTGTLTKDDQGYYEEPISNWSVRGSQTVEDLAKEIKYGDDVFAKK